MRRVNFFNIVGSNTFFSHNLMLRGLFSGTKAALLDCNDNQFVELKKRENDLIERLQKLIGDQTFGQSKCHRHDYVSQLKKLAEDLEKTREAMFKFKKTDVDSNVFPKHVKVNNTDVGPGAPGC